MIFAFLFTVFVGVCAVALIGLEDSHNRVTRLLQELDEQAAERTQQQERGQPVATGPMVTVPATADAFRELSFTRSLLALSKADSPVPYDFPLPVLDESSLSASVPLDQSKNRVQVL